MQLINFWPADDEQLAGQWLLSFYSGEDADWWVGTQRCAANLALALSLSLAASSTTLATAVFSQLEEPVAVANVVQGFPAEDYAFYGFISA